MLASLLSCVLPLVVFPPLVLRISKICRRGSSRRAGVRAPLSRIHSKEILSSWGKFKIIQKLL